MRGKKTAPKTIYAVMASYFITGSLKETAELFELAISTVKSIVDKNKDKPEFVKLRNEKTEKFSDDATRIIDKGMHLIEKRIDRAIEQETALDVFIDEVYSADRDEFSPEEKKTLAAKLRTLQIQDIRALTTAVATMYDKRALAQGKSTQNIKIDVKLPPGCEEYAG